jgi:hypothetical protein
VVIGGALWTAVNAAAFLFLARRVSDTTLLWTLPAILAVNIGFAILVAGFRAGGWFVSRSVLISHAVAAAFAYASTVRPLASVGFSRLGPAFFLAVQSVLFAWIGLHNLQRSARSLRIWIVVTSFLVYAGAAIFLAPRTNPEGDEPHYLLATHSLVADGDFDLKNDYREKKYAAFYRGEIEERHVLVNRRNEDVPIHDVGLSILLAPGYAAGIRPGAMIELSLFGAVLALGIYELSRQLGASRLAAVRTWAFFAFTSPLLVYSSQIYPDIIACACCVWSVAALGCFRRTGSQTFLLAAGCLLAILPWLSVRYWFLVAPLGLSMVASAIRGPAGRGSLAGRLALLAMPGIASVALFALFDLRWYQTPMPNGGYVLYVLGHKPPMFSPQFMDVSFLGLLFDRAFGLLPTAPVYVIALAGAVLAWKSSRWIAATILAAAAVFFLFAAANQFWYGGWAPPPRYLVPAIALIAPLASLALEGNRTSWLTRLLVAGSSAVALVYTAAPETRYSYWDFRPGALATLLIRRTGIDYGAVLPSFIRAELRDYLLMLFWAVAAALAIRSLLLAAEEPNRSRRALLDGHRV